MTEDGLTPSAVLGTSRTGRASTSALVHRPDAHPPPSRRPFRLRSRVLVPPAPASPSGQPQASRARPYPAHPAGLSRFTRRGPPGFHPATHRPRPQSVHPPPLSLAERVRRSGLALSRHPDRRSLYPEVGIGLINSAVLLRSSSDKQLASIFSLVSVDIIKASLYPVRTPLYILIFQSFYGNPIVSTLRLILCSIGDKITQASEEEKLHFSPCYCTKSLILYDPFDSRYIVIMCFYQPYKS